MPGVVERRGKGKRSVLIADDNDGVRAVISFYFTALHCKTTTCNNLSSTLAHLKNGFFDLLVLDLYLGDEPGLEVLRWMNQNKVQVPTVLMSGSDDIFAVEQARRLGIIEFWPKPTRFQTAHRLAQRLWSSRGPDFENKGARSDPDSALDLGDVVEQLRPRTHPYSRSQHQHCAQSK